MREQREIVDKFLFYLADKKNLSTISRCYRINPLFLNFPRYFI